jgi:predicted Zn-dependent protease
MPEAFLSLNRVAVSVGGAFVVLATALVARSAVLDPVAQAAEADALPDGTDADGALERIVPAEIARIFTRIAQEAEPAHWMAVGVVERRSVDVEATHGAAGPVHTSAGRLADLDLRVGTPALDNTHKIRDAGWFDDEPRPSLDLPLSDDVPWAIQAAIWRTADDAYRAGVRRLIKVRTNDIVKVSREDLSADFSTAPVARYDEPGIPLVVDGEAWQGRVRAASKVFLEYPDVFDSNVSLRAQDDLHHVWTSEGTAVTWRRHSVRVATWGSTVADDGMKLEVYDYVDGRTVESMPSEDELEAMVRSVATRVTALRKAPLVEPYVGPAILRGRAAAVFFHEIFGHRVEGHRQKDEDEGQTFTDKVGQAILPSFLSVYDDPTRTKWGDVDLAGSYPYDDEGVAATRASLVDKGVLLGFLLSRSPIKGFEHSNGHGRRQPGNAVVARQGNLVVEASRSVSYDDLRAQLVAEVKRQNKPFGLVFDDISGGFTFTGRSTPNAFTVKPVTVWRVFADGRPDELVRGVDMIGTPLTTFSRILAASDRTEVFNGVCGAESGWVPVSAVAPDLLVSEVEVQRKEKENDRPPLLGAPEGAEPGKDS